MLFMARDKPSKMMEVFGMSATENQPAPVPAGDEGVRMYPANQLKDQVRDPKDAFSAFKLLRETFGLPK